MGSPRQAPCISLPFSPGFGMVRRNDSAIRKGRPHHDENDPGLMVLSCPWSEPEEDAVRSTLGQADVTSRSNPYPADPAPMPRNASVGPLRT